MERAWGALKSYHKGHVSCYTWYLHFNSFNVFKLGERWSVDQVYVCRYKSLIADWSLSPSIYIYIYLYLNISMYTHKFIMVRIHSTNPSSELDLRRNRQCLVNFLKFEEGGRIITMISFRPRSPVRVVGPLPNGRTPWLMRIKSWDDPPSTWSQ